MMTDYLHNRRKRMSYYQPYGKIIEDLKNQYNGNVRNNYLGIVEDADGKPQIELVLLVAGIAKEDISVNTSQDELIVKVSEKASTKFSAVKREKRIPINFLHTGNYEGKKVNYEAATATVENGLLTILIPLYEEDDNFKQIEIN